MAKLHGDFRFTGSLGDLSAYKMKGSDKLILRRKGGASRRKIQTAPQFETTRRLNVEFGGRAAVSKWALKTLRLLKHLSDHSFSGKLNALLKPAQEMDTISEFGKRHIQLSLMPKSLEGFNLNRQNPFETVITNPVQATLSRETRAGTIEIPRLRPGINLHLPDDYRMYRLTIVLGVVPDLFFDERRSRRYDIPGAEYMQVALSPQTVHSDWFYAKEGSPVLKLEISFPLPIPDNNFSLMMAIGLELGDMPTQPAKYAGCAKILMMA